MGGETDLNSLLKGLSPELLPDHYVFVTLPGFSSELFDSLTPIGMFQEAEGTTLILTENAALNAGLAYNGVFRCITCKVHSSLEAVGMTAAMSAALTAKGISANVVAAYYHDHIFVPAAYAELAVVTLLALSSPVVANYTNSHRSLPSQSE